MGESDGPPGVWTDCLSTLTRAVVHCAIYTRKSSEEGLEQAFNSLDAQREAGEAFILSQQQAGWFALPDRYDDGGFTGSHARSDAPPRTCA
jgi:site-specific DNA recombinase